MLTRSLRMFMGLFVITVCPVADSFAQSAKPSVVMASTQNLAELENDLAAGREVSFRVKYNSTGLDSPGTQRLFACCGRLAVYMADGVVTLSRTAVTFSGSVGAASFSVSPDKILEALDQPAQSARIQLAVAIKNRKGDKEDKKNFYIYNPAARGVGDGAVGGPGASISCGGCDNSMTRLFTLLSKVRSGQLTTSETLATSNAGPETAVAAGPVASAGAKGSGMTNDEVIKLGAAGLSDSVIATAVRQAPAKAFDLTPAGLIALKKAGVSDAVILAMQSAATTPVAGNQAAPAARREPSQDSQTPVAAPPPSPCAEIDYLGVIQAVTGGGQMAGRNAYGGRIRNRASYTKEVDFAWIMNGRAETGTFRVPAGQFIDVNLGQGSAAPTNVRVVTCR